MEDAIMALGQVRVILVLNMKRFICEEDRIAFESVRGSKTFANELRSKLMERIQAKETFAPVDYATEKNDPEKIGFLTGIFRQSLFEDHFTPTYFLRKEKVQFAESLRDNFQFKKIFQQVWDHWDIFIRATVTGMFIVTLKRRYTKARSLLGIASDVVKLQTSFDVPAALSWQKKLGEELFDDPKSRASKEESIRTFLEWIGHSSEPGYVPVQWRLAMEVCSRFVHDLMCDAAPYTLQADATHQIRFQVPKPSVSTPLHDSYVTYRFEQLVATPNLLEAPINPAGSVHRVSAPSGARVLVTPADLQGSEPIKRELARLIEGAVIKNGPGATETTRRFPRHRQSYIESVFENDITSWTDELCLLTSRAAIIIPAWNSKQDELFVSTLPATTSRIGYTAYWDAVERMIELLLEIRTLAQLVERSSADALQNLNDVIKTIRSDVMKGNMRIKIPRMLQIVNQAANLSRLVSLCQGLSNPHVWSRAEYGLSKAKTLLKEFGVPILLAHSQRNVNNMTDLINHLDELHLAALSERNSKQTFWIAAGISALSIFVLLYALPSFWADLDMLKTPPDERVLLALPMIAGAGTVFAALLIIVAASLVAVSIFKALKS